MLELIKILKEIQADHQDRPIWFPEFLTDPECLEGHEKQESDCRSIEYEYVCQSGGHFGDDFSGTIIYPFKDMFIKVRFEC